MNGLSGFVNEALIVPCFRINKLLVFSHRWWTKDSSHLIFRTEGGIRECRLETNHLRFFIYHGFRAFPPIHCLSLDWLIPVPTVDRNQFTSRRHNHVRQTQFKWNRQQFDSRHIHRHLLPFRNKNQSQFEQTIRRIFQLSQPINTAIARTMISTSRHDTTPNANIDIDHLR